MPDHVLPQAHNEGGTDLSDALADDVDNVPKSSAQGKQRMHYLTPSPFFDTEIENKLSSYLDG